MLRYCTSCGKEVPDGVEFCTECGCKLEKPVNNPVVQKTVAPVVTGNDSDVVSTGAYFGLMLLFAIPVVGFIACLIMSFASKNKNIKHYSRAVLIWTIIVAVLTIILSIIGYLLMDSLMDYINQSYGGSMNSFTDIFSDFSELEGVLEQYNELNIENIQVQ